MERQFQTILTLIIRSKIYLYLLADELAVHHEETHPTFGFRQEAGGGSGGSVDLGKVLPPRWALDKKQTQDDPYEIQILRRAMEDLPTDAQSPIII